ncbi:T9SS type A sorting domain-containing protein [Mucilaginibacter corticis]|uniref:T9SS type A sorting domain-containing protein n=1 Tax=Mucilaginibacter corticis TaxID=2597670 RepID=A0A556MKR7_9SPHI|nr:T9SS type A sorting domain-containing protein [Mucilaginibacter corticis]TSJ40409.1 T9SS type A sorting domain-containing protein [Mucilaginibacter corticis]
MKTFLQKLLLLVCLFGALGYGKAYATPTITLTSPAAVTVLPGGTFTITATITKFLTTLNLSNVTLTVPPSSVISNTITGSTYSYSSGPLTVSTTPGTYLYQLTATDAGGLGGGMSGNTTITVTVSKTYNWNGAGTSFSTGTNWTPTGPPTANDIAQIGVLTYASGTNQPSIGTSTGVFQLVLGPNNTPALTIGSTATLSVGNDAIVNASTNASLVGAGALSVSGNFTNGTGSNFSITSNGLLTVKNSFTNNSTATFTGTSSSTVNIAGGTQTITNLNTTASPTVKFGNVIFAGGTKTFAAGGYYSVAAGSTMLVGTSTTVIIPNSSPTNYTHLVFLTDLVSPYVNYAQIATIPSGSSIQGNIDYPVNFTGGAGYRNYRSMASPVYDNTTTYSASNGTYKYSNLKSTFIITGTGGATNGFDLSSNNGSTIKTYVPATNGYTFLPNLTSPTSVATTGVGFYMYFRGNRTPTGTTTAADFFGSKTNKVLGGGSYAIPEANMVYTYTGIPNQGNVTTDFGTLASGATNKNYYFMANPYAATLDFDQVYTSNPYLYIDATLSILGYPIFPQCYIWNPPTASYIIYDSKNPTASPGKRYIVPGQGFFVRANTSNTLLNVSPTTITITESMKSVGSNSNAGRYLNSAPAQASAEPPIMRLQAYKNENFNEEIGIVLNSTSKDSLDNGDGGHLEWTNMILSTITPDNQYLSIDKRSIKEKRKIIPLYINSATDSIYTFKTMYSSAVMKANYRVWLRDHLTGDSIDIAHNNYDFRIDLTNTATVGSKRFDLVLVQTPPPATVLTFSGKLNADKKGVLNWQTSAYVPGVTYQLQRSADSINFVNIDAALVPADSIVNNNYQYIDDKINPGKNYYRLIQTDLFNNQVISSTVMLDNSGITVSEKEVKGIMLYPNPVVTNSFNIISEKTYSGKITLTIYNSNSTVVGKNTFTQLDSTTPIQENVGQLKTGVYVAEVKVDDTVICGIKFIKQ